MSWVTNYAYNRKSLEYFIQLLGKNHLQVFLKAIFVTRTILALIEKRCYHGNFVISHVKFRAKIKE